MNIKQVIFLSSIFHKLAMNNIFLGDFDEEGGQLILQSTDEINKETKSLIKLIAEFAHYQEEHEKLREDYEENFDEEEDGDFDSFTGGGYENYFSRIKNRIKDIIGPLVDIVGQLNLFESSYHFFDGMISGLNRSNFPFYDTAGNLNNLVDAQIPVLDTTRLVEILQQEEKNPTEELVKLKHGLSTILRYLITILEQLSPDIKTTQQMETWTASMEEKFSDLISSISEKFKNLDNQDFENLTQEEIEELTVSPLRKYF